MPTECTIRSQYVPGSCGPFLETHEIARTNRFNPRLDRRQSFEDISAKVKLPLNATKVWEKILIPSPPKSAIRLLMPLRAIALLQATKPEDAQPEDLVFPSPEGKFINFHNFRNRGWATVIASLPAIAYRKPYQTRHTFITLVLENGLEAKDVARLVGNSPEMIYKHYAGRKRELFVPEF